MVRTSELRRDEELGRRAEALLESLAAVVSARVLLDQAAPPQVHVLSTSAMPVSEVHAAVTSALLSGLDLSIPASRISVAQSRLTRDELEVLLGRDVGRPAEDPPATSPMPGQEAAPQTDAREGDPQGAGAVAPRLEFLNFHVVKNEAGGLDIGVRLGGAGGPVESRREGSDNDESLHELPAAATLEAVQDLLASVGWNGGRHVSLELLGTRRLFSAHHDSVVVLVEATVDDRKLTLAGVSSADNGTERAAIMATLQATNQLVAGLHLAESNGRTTPEPNQDPSDDAILAWPLSEAHFR